jgi:hypothetical protein
MAARGVEGTACSAKDNRTGRLNRRSTQSIQDKICKPMIQLVYFFAGLTPARKLPVSNGKYKEFRPLPTTRAMHIAHTAFPGRLKRLPLFPPMRA